MIRYMAVVLMESLQHQGRITLAVPMKIPVRYGSYPVLSSNYYAKLWCFDCLRLITAKLLESTEFAANSYLQTHLRISRHGKKLISMYNIIWDTFALCLTVFFFFTCRNRLGVAVRMGLVKLQVKRPEYWNKSTFNELDCTACS